jgi:hypothetical protein
MNYTIHIQLFGNIPIAFVVKILKEATKAWPGCVCLDSTHPLSKATQATMTIASEVKE